MASMLIWSALDPGGHTGGFLRFAGICTAAARGSAAIAVVWFRMYPNRVLPRCESGDGGQRVAAVMTLIGREFHIIYNEAISNAAVYESVIDDSCFAKVGVVVLDGNLFVDRIPGNLQKVKNRACA